MFTQEKVREIAGMQDNLTGWQNIFNVLLGAGLAFLTTLHFWKANKRDSDHKAVTDNIAAIKIEQAQQVRAFADCQGQSLRDREAGNKTIERIWEIMKEDKKESMQFHLEQIRSLTAIETGFSAFRDEMHGILGQMVSQNKQ